MDDFELNYNEILKRIDLLIETDSRKVKKYMTYLGKDRQAFYHWKQGRYKPSLEDLIKTAKYFGVPLEYILAGEETPIDDATAAFIVRTKGLTEEQKKIIYASLIAQIDMFKRMNEEKK